MFRSKAAAFLSNSEGNVAIIFAVALPVIVGAVGGGIDLARASKMRAALTQAVDAAALRIEETKLSCPQSSRQISYDVSECTIQTGERVKSFAHRLVTAEFQSAGYESKLDINPTISLNPTNNRVIVKASSSYACTIFKIVSPNCDVTVGSEAAASKSAGNMTLNVPASGELWLGELGSPTLPTRISAAGGKAPHTFAIGPNLPDGLKLDALTGTISGKPAEIPCEQDCVPQIRKVAISASDSSTPSRQTATGVITYQIIHPLKLEVVPAKPGQASIPRVVRTGGKPPFQFLCTSPLTNISCHPSTGQISFFPGVGGEITFTVIDARGISVSKKAHISR